MSSLAPSRPLDAPGAATGGSKSEREGKRLEGDASRFSESLDAEAREYARLAPDSPQRKELLSAMRARMAVAGEEGAWAAQFEAFIKFCDSDHPAAVARRVALDAALAKSRERERAAREVSKAQCVEEREKFLLKARAAAADPKPLSAADRAELAFFSCEAGAEPPVYHRLLPTSR